MAGALYLYCEETKHGVQVGQDSMGAYSTNSEPENVISLFCKAHMGRQLVVVADPELAGNWDEGTAPDLFTAITGQPAPQAWSLISKAL